MKRSVFVIAIIALGSVALPRSAHAQTRPAWGRIAFFGNGASTLQDTGFRSSFSELIANVTFESASGEDVNYEYRADIRLAGYPSARDRTRRVSIYDAYAGVRLRGGTIGIRGGQMWLNDLGGLGSLGGAMVEFRQPKRSRGGRWRAMLFGGLEPKTLDVGYESSVVKAGGLVAYDGEGMRRHVLGFVNVRDGGMTERAVIVVTNFLPAGKRFSAYQSAEYDVRGPGVSGAGSLTYIFTNARYVVSDRVELQGTFHRGRSIDSRSIIRDQLDGRPIDPRALEGLRFESVSGRATVTIARNVRVYAGYGQDRNNRDDSVAGRATFGVFASNVARSGLDFAASDSRIDRGAGGSYDSWYVSLGRSIGAHIYLTGDFSSSLSVFRFTRADGFLIETRPQTRRMALSGVFNLSGGTSLMMTAERILDGSSTQTRMLSGMTFRF